MIANLILSNCLPLIPIRFDKRDLVSLNTSSYVLLILAQLFDNCGITHRFDEELERNTMRLARLLFEVKAVDKTPLISFLLFLGHLFRVQPGKFRENNHWIIWEKLFVHFVIAHLAYPHVLRGLIVQFGLLLQTLVEVAYSARFGDEDLEELLQLTSGHKQGNKFAKSQTSLDIPSVTQLIFRLFFVSISLRLMSRIS